MFIQSNTADFGVRHAYRIPRSGAIRTQHVSYRIRVVSVALFGFMLLILSTIAVARTEVIPEVIMPPPAYLPGNSLPRFSDKDVCTFLPSYQPSCLGHLRDYDIYWAYDPRTYKIVRTTITADNRIGNLILAWGTPTGFDQYGTSIVVSWGTRSALLVTNSFQPYSRVRFIEYATEPLKRSPWRGFVGHKSDDLSQ